MGDRNALHRVGTWNLDGRWSADHEALIASGDCPIWLLTEVPHRTVIPGFTLHPTTDDMAGGRHWAAVAARNDWPTTPRAPDLHPTSATVSSGALTYCASVLPWRSCGTAAPWRGRTVASKARAATQPLASALPRGNTLWGGDWNHSFRGRETAGSLQGREAISEALEALGLQLATAELPHRLDGVYTIDHIAVPSDATVVTAERVPASVGTKRLSDHDAYVVEFTLPHRWSVYVLEVLGGPDNEVYVGQTWNAPEHRRQQHIDGPKRGRIFARRGRNVGALRPDLLPQIGPLTTQDAALVAENDVKALLRSRGFTVHGNA